MNYGTRVRIKDSLLYTGRTGTLKPISEHPEDPWDYYVDLDAIGTLGIETARTIGVHDFQVVPL